MRKRPSAQALDFALGGALRSRREALGLSLEGLARRVGLPAQSLHYYEEGRHRIPAGALLLIARGLGAHLSDYAKLHEDAAPSELQALARLKTPGAAALLRAYAGLTPPQRRALLQFLK